MRTRVPTVSFLPFHPDQKRVYKAFKGQKMAKIVLRAGRRYGKSTLFEQAAAKWALAGDLVGWFAPDYKILLPSYKRILRLLKDAVAHHSKTDGIIECVPTDGRAEGGSVEFWTLNNPDAGRSRHYHRVIVDEAGLILKGLKDIFEQAIEPTLWDTGGSCYMAGTPKGASDDSYFYQACTNKELGWEEFHIPTQKNPHLNAEKIAKLQDTMDPDVYAQEVLALFIDWRGKAFFSLDKWLDDDGQAYDPPTKCDSVFCVIDSAIKDGFEHDGTAVVYYARDKFHGKTGKPLMILDWDIVQVKGAFLEDWLPSVYARLKELAEEVGARAGAAAPFIEDKASGAILLQQAERRGWKATPIDSDLVGAGKDGRGFTASGPHYQRKVGISKYAYEKTVRFKGVTKNHLVSQVMGYRIGDPESAKRPDDLYDGYVYGVSLALGDRRGH